MARKSKIEPEKQEAAGTEESARATNGAGAPKAKVKSVSSSAKKKQPAAKKKAAPAKKRAAPTKSASPAKASGPSDEEIRIRAYFIAERRLQLSLPGDSAHDWIEAKRQLIEEAGPASS